MEEGFFEGIYNWFKRFAPYILVGALGAIVHRLRVGMTWKKFIGALFISILVSLSVGVVCKEYTPLKTDVIFVLCGISGAFSKHLLDELEEIISELSGYVKRRLGLKEKNQENKDINL